MTFRIVELTDATGAGLGLWRFCEVINGRPIPTGYCAGTCVGHPTAAAARAHYLEFLHTHDLNVVTDDADDPWYYDPYTDFATHTYLASVRLGVRIPISPLNARDVAENASPAGIYTDAMVQALEEDA